MCFSWHSETETTIAGHDRSENIPPNVPGSDASFLRPMGCMMPNSLCPLACRGRPIEFGNKWSAGTATRNTNDGYSTPLLTWRQHLHLAAASSLKLIKCSILEGYSADIVLIIVGRGPPLQVRKWARRSRCRLPPASEAWPGRALDSAARLISSAMCSRWRPDRSCRRSRTVASDTIAAVRREI